MITQFQPGIACITGSLPGITLECGGIRRGISHFTRLPGALCIFQFYEQFVLFAVIKTCAGLRNGHPRRKSQMGRESMASENVACGYSVPACICCIFPFTLVYLYAS